MSLRDYQAAAVDAIRARFLAGDRSTLLVMPTGTGKTHVIAETARLTVARGGRVLVLAHRTELLEQARAKLIAAGCDAEIQQGRRRAGHASVVVASVQSLKGKRLASFAPDAFRLLVVDEAHHALAAAYRAVLACFSSAHVLGVTATPDRLDGQALGDVFDSVAFTYELRAAIAEGNLVPIVARRVHLEHVDLGAVGVRGGDLDERQLAEAMTAEAALHGVVVPLMREAAARRCLVFAVDVAHAQALARVLNGYRPGCAVAVDGDTPQPVRAAALADLAAGRVQFVVNCQLYTEGTDVPSVEVIAMARPTKSRALYVQCLGRGLRPSPETLKRDCLVLDFVGSVGRHRLAGPADVLAGHFVAPEAQALLDEAMLLGAVELEAALVAAVATAEANARAEAASAVARYRVEELDPWLSVSPVDVHASQDAATEKQLEALKKAGVTVRAGATACEAGRILAAVAQRRDAGLCSVKAAKLLMRAGLPVEVASRLSAADAKPLLSALRASGWRWIPRSLLARHMPATPQPSTATEAA